MTGSMVLGVDLSLVSTGLAWEPDCTGRIRTSAKGWAREDDRLRAIWSQVVERAGELRQGKILESVLVVIEGLSYGTSTGSASTRAGLHYLTRRGVLDAGHRFVIVPPATLKKFATGKGNASKELVVSTVARRIGREIASDDVADALVLLAIGQALEGQERTVLGPVSNDQRKALEKVERSW